VPRKGHIPRREVLPDPVYKDLVVAKLINNVMLDGRKQTSQQIVYDAFDIIKTKTGKDAVEVFKQAMDNIMPVLEVKARRVGGSTYQVPMEVRPDRRQALGLRWLVQFARTRNERTMKERLAAEIIDATNGVGNTFKRKEEMHRMAEANKAFAHYRW
jgi:small subunit ribosomal protein S7